MIRMVKYRIVLESESNKKHPRILKLNVPPGKNQGFMNFVNQSVKEGRSITIYFEKVDGMVREKSKLKGEFRFHSD